MRSMRLLYLAVLVVIAVTIPDISIAKERTGEVTIQFNLNAPADAKEVRLWVPYPVSDENQTVEDIKVTGNFSGSSVYREGENGNMALYAEWNAPAKERSLTYTIKVKRKETLKKDLVEYYFGGLDESRVAYQTGRDLILAPAQRGDKLNYFMYPYAEADGKALNEDLFGFNLGYKITFKEL